MREIKDDILRMGASSKRRSARDGRPGCARRADRDGRDRRRRDDQRDATRITGLITRTIATQSPVARDLRFLLALDHVGYELERMGDHAASVAKQVRKLAPEPPLQPLCRPPGDGRPRRDAVSDILLALVDVDVDRGTRVAARDDEIDDLYHKTFAEVVELMRAGPGQRRTRHPDPVRLALRRADRRPGHEHRRGRGLPRERRDRGPQSMTEPTRVLFVSTGGACRAIFARALLRHVGGGAFDAWACGTDPAPIDPLTIQVLHEAGIDGSGLEPRALRRGARQAVRLRHHGL